VVLHTRIEEDPEIILEIQYLESRLLFCDFLSPHLLGSSLRFSLTFVISAGNIPKGKPGQGEERCPMARERGGAPGTNRGRGTPGGKAQRQNRLPPLPISPERGTINC